MLDARDMASLAMVNKAFNKLASDDLCWRSQALKKLGVVAPREPPSFSWKQIFRILCGNVMKAT